MQMELFSIEKEEDEQQTQVVVVVYSSSFEYLETAVYPYNRNLELNFNCKKQQAVSGKIKLVSLFLQTIRSDKRRGKQVLDASQSVSQPFASQSVHSLFSSVTQLSRVL